ncbi:hypothetical protein [Chitinophaga pinensis]|uniref:Lipoprotein n=1 Tax=Chitinophaga pinensis TaxID=79329 RepID=A0A5C6LNB5_9BACT|nr:hypothetical protein [Chitinophaga pinensis]TWV95714.1 hypothetical protein FEF09_24070 [Chitinophaga pinensis]
MKYAKIYALSCVAAFLSACHQPAENTQNTAAQFLDSDGAVSKKAQGNHAATLLPVNREDAGYPEGGQFPQDTLTASGWSVRYLVKDDNTKYKDLYVECSNGKSKLVIPQSQVLALSWKYIPRYAGENTKHLFFEYYCGNECFAVMTVSKESQPEYQEYEQVLDYDVLSGQIVYNITSSDTEDSVRVVAVNVARRKEKKMAFNNMRRAGANAGIDSVVFKSGKVQVFAGLIDRNDPEEEDIIKESRSVSFDN